MERSAEKDKITEEYWEGRRKLPDNDSAIDKYNAIYDSKVRSLFGGWINFGRYQSNYQSGDQTNESNSLQEQINSDSSNLIKGIERSILKEENNSTESSRTIIVPSIKKAFLDAGIEYPFKKSD